MFDLSSAQNPKIKQIMSLRDRKARDETSLFIIEGYREISRAVQGGVQFESLFVSPEHFLGENEEALISSINAPKYRLPKHLFEKISYRDRPDGLIAIAKQMKLTLLDLPKNSVYLIAEAIEKPGNLGTIIRSSDAAGVGGVIVCDRCTDIYNPNVVRASVGTLFTLPVIETTSQEAYIWLKDQNITIVAATPSAEAFYTDTNLSGGLAIVVGTEQLGLSSFWMEKAEVKVKIPMLGVADSLNVATATTLLLYEALRQNTLLR
jgi:TrmH family RNA methyltransferase